MNINQSNNTQSPSNNSSLNEWVMFGENNAEDRAKNLFQKIEEASSTFCDSYITDGDDLL